MTKTHGIETAITLFTKQMFKSQVNVKRYRGTQREYSSKPLKHSIVKRILVFKR